VLKSVRYAPFLQWSVQLQIVLSIGSLCSLPITVCAAADSVVHQIALLPSNNGLRHSEKYCTSGRCAPFLHWYFALLCVRSLCSLPTTVRPQLVCKLYVRLLCSLPSLVICTVVCQVAVLSSFTVNLHCCASGRSAPSCSNLFQFYPIYLNFS